MQNLGELPRGTKLVLRGRTIGTSKDEVPLGNFTVDFSGVSIDSLLRLSAERILISYRQGMKGKKGFDLENARNSNPTVSALDYVIRSMRTATLTYEEWVETGMKMSALSTLSDANRKGLLAIALEKRTLGDIDYDN